MDIGPVTCQDIENYRDLVNEILVRSHQVATVPMSPFDPKSTSVLRSALRSHRSCVGNSLSLFLLYLTFLSKLIEKVIARRLFAHLQDNGIMEKFQSAYKTKHSTETALLRVYNDVMFCIDQGKGCILVLLDLSAAFDTVDHAVLFNRLEHSLGISGTALSLLKSYLQGRSQCVQIDGITSEFADLT